MYVNHVNANILRLEYNIYTTAFVAAWLRIFHEIRNYKVKSAGDHEVDCRINDAIEIYVAWHKLQISLDY